MEDSAAVCPSCGKGGAPSAGATTSGGGGLTDNVAGMLAYVTIIPAILFLILEPYNKNRFVRFHAFQCIFLAVGLFVIQMVLAFIPIIGWLISLLVSLGTLALWIVLLIKAYGGQMFKLPVIGDMAEKQANAM